MPLCMHSKLRRYCPALQSLRVKGQVPPRPAHAQQGRLAGAVQALVGLMDLVQRPCA